MKTIRSIAAAAAVGLVLTLAGCGSAPDRDSSDAGGTDLIEKAQEEGVLTWYTVLDPNLAQSIADEFTEKYDVQVEIYRAISADMLQRYRSERDAGSTVADVITDAQTAPFIADAQDDEFVDITTRELPALEEWPDDEVFGDVTMRLHEGPFLLPYNTDEVAEGDVPTDWLDVLEPPLSNELAVPTFASASIYVDWLYVLREEYGDDFIRDVGNLPATRYDSAVPALQSIASGEQSIMMPAPSGLAVPVINSGAPMDYVIPEVTPTLSVFGAVPTQAPNPNAALLFLDFLMSEEGQTVLNEGIGASVLGDLPGTIPRGDGWVRPDSAAAAAARDELLALLDQ